MSKVYKSYNGGQFADIDDGVVKSTKDIKEDIQEYQIAIMNESNELLVLIGEEPTQLIKVSDREITGVEIKKDFEFNKTFRAVMRNIMQGKNVAVSKLSLNACAFIAKLEPFCTFPHNIVKIDGIIPTQEELMELIGVGNRKYREVMKELEDNQIIKRIPEAHKLIGIYFNPFLYCTGLYIHPDTYNIFKDSIYAEAVKFENFAIKNSGHKARKKKKISKKKSITNN